MSTDIEGTNSAHHDFAALQASPNMEQEQAVANSSEVENDGEVVAKASATPKKTPVKRKATPKKVAAKKNDGDELAEPTTPPKPTRKRTPKAKKEMEVKSEAKAVEDEDAGSGDEATSTPAPASSKKRGTKAAEKSEDATPTKKRKTKAETNGDAATPAKKTPGKAAGTPKAKGSKFPECFEEFSEADKLLVHMRNENKQWPEIEAAWTAVTGQTPGKDVLRKRYPKLVAVGIEWKAGDARKLVQFKAEVELESVAALKKLEAEKWGRVVEKFKAVGSDYSSPSLQKKWELMQKKGEIKATGEYVGDDAEISDDAADGAEVNMEEDGDADMEHEDGSEGVADVENEEA